MFIVFIEIILNKVFCHKTLENIKFQLENARSKLTLKNIKLLV